MVVGEAKAGAERVGDQAVDQAVDLPRLVAGIKRRRRWVVLTTLAAMLASAAFVLVVPPRYTGVAKVLLEDQESYYTKPDKAPGFDPAETIDDAAVQSQAEAVATADLARKAIDKLGLATNPEFGGGGDKADPRAVDKFLSRLTVFPVPRSRVLQIEFVSRDPELAARGANTVAEIYLQSQTQAKAEAARSAGAWLARKIEELRTKVADADAKVEAFRAESGLLSGADGQTVSAEQLSDLNAQLAAARSAEAGAAAKAELLRTLEREGRLDEAPASIAEESMRRFVEQRVALKAEIAEASRTLLPLHPRMKELAAQLAALDAQIHDAAAKNVRIFENDARLAGDQVASLRATLAQQSKTVATGNADDVRLRALDMEAKGARDQLESYLQKYREAEARVADNAAPANARVIATAEPPRAPTFPKVWQTILLATLAGFVVSTGVAAAAALASGEPEFERGASCARGNAFSTAGWRTRAAGGFGLGGAGPVRAGAHSGKGRRTTPVCRRAIERRTRLFHRQCEGAGRFRIDASARRPPDAVNGGRKCRRSDRRAQVRAGAVGRARNGAASCRQRRNLARRPRRDAGLVR